MRGKYYQYVVLIEELLLIALTYNGRPEAYSRCRFRRLREECKVKRGALAEGRKSFVG
jgi:hypothetical protein